MVASYDMYKYQRVESRAVSLLLSCVPPSFKDELITNRWMTSASILYRILCVYQPGGSMERGYLLSRLVQPESCKSYKDAIVCLRRWQQDLIRAREVQATLPDPSLLLKGIDAATSSLLNLQPMVAFRISAFRHKSSIDYNPSVSGVIQLVRLIQAECESMAMTVENPDKRARAAAATAKAEPPSAKAPTVPPVPPPPPSGVSVARVGEGDNKGKGKGKGDGAGGSQPCTKFSDATGCRFGDSCHFRHDRGAARKQGRCLACGQKGHYRPDCTLVAAENRQVASGDSSEGASPKAGAGQSRKGEPKAKAKAGAQAKGITEDSGATAGSLSGTPEGASTSSVSSADRNALLAEAAKLLNKGTAVKGLKVRSSELDLHGIDQSWLLSAVASPSDNRFALIDSGATNGLRPAVSDEELQGSRAIHVDLASGTTQLRINDYGTLLTDGPCQVIVPAGYLAELGYAITWKRKGCCVRHPTKGTLEVQVRKGCPLIPREVGLELLGYYEARRAKSVVARCSKLSPLPDDVGPGNVRGWMCERLRIQGSIGRGDLQVFLRVMFPGLSDSDVSQALPSEVVNICQTERPWNRRFRRSVEREDAGGVLLRFSSSGSKWKGPGRVVDVDKRFGSDIMSDSVFGLVLKWASSGVVGGVVSSTSGQSLSCLTASGESEAQGALTSEDIGWLRQLAVFAVAQAASDLRAQNNKGPDRDKPTEFDEDDVPPSDIVDPEALVQWALDRAAVKLQLGRAGGISEGNFVKGFSVFLVLGPPCKWEATAESEPGCLGFKGAEVWKEVYDWYGVRYKSKSDGLAVSEGLVTTSWYFFESLEGLEVWNGLSEFKGRPVFGEWSPELVGV